MVVKMSFLAGLIVVTGLIWLLIVWYQGNQTYQWHPAQIESFENDVAGRGIRRGMPTGFKTKVRYNFKGAEFESTVDEYLTNENKHVWIHPNDPSRVVAVQGVTIQAMMAPIVIVVAASLFLIAILLIKLSPADD